MKKQQEQEQGTAFDGRAVEQSPDGRPPAREGRAIRRSTAGEKDAAPSNTASDSCNGVLFKPLRWGVDSLYLSFQGELYPSEERRLKELKEVAQLPEAHEQAFAQCSLGTHLFEVKDKGSGMFPYVLEDNAFRLALSRPGKRLPMAYVKLSSAYLLHADPEVIESYLRGLLDQLGEVTESASVSRVDLYVDFVSSVDMESWAREAWVTRAASVNQYSVGNQFSGWAIGLGGVMACRLYDKTLEIETSKKEYLRPLWRERGWEDGERVWRLEFQFRREVLDQKGVQKLYSVLVHLNGLWSYATTEWLRLTMPNSADKTRSRWPIHPLWIALASVDWEGERGPMLPRFSSSRAPKGDWVCRQAFSALTSFMATQGEWDFYRAWSLLRERVEVYYATRMEAQGLRFDKFVEEQVRIKGRKFNTIDNASEIPNEDNIRAEYEEGVREYRRQTRGG